LVVLNGLLVDVKDADALAKKLMETGYSVAASTTPITVDQAKSMAINN
jgi:hypothetical protein